MKLMINIKTKIGEEILLRGCYFNFMVQTRRGAQSLRLLERPGYGLSWVGFQVGPFSLVLDPQIKQVGLLVFFLFGINNDPCTPRISKGTSLLIVNLGNFCKANFSKGTPPFLTTNYDAFGHLQYRHTTHQLDRHTDYQRRTSKKINK